MEEVDLRCVVWDGVLSVITSSGLDVDMENGIISPKLRAEWYLWGRGNSHLSAENSDEITSP